MLIDDVRRQMKDAMRARRERQRDTLRLVLSELQASETRQGHALSDAQGAKVIRKLMKSNQETLGLTKEPASRERLEEENRLLASLLPEVMAVDEIRAALAPIAGEIRAAGSDGQATGIAMKHLKSQGAAVTGDRVAQTVQQMREGT